MMNNNYTDIEHLKLVAQRLAEAGRDITADYADWINVTFACAYRHQPAPWSPTEVCSTEEEGAGEPHPADA